MAGDTDLSFGTAPSVLAQVDSGKLRAIAVSTREKSALVPKLPGMKEAGLPDYNLEFWYGIFVPRNTPDAVVKKLYDAAVFAMNQANVKSVLAREGTEPSLSSSPEAFGTFLDQDEKFWVKLAKDANIVVN
jgi:tripartite-type tricarboxylate transporter receptor subunit TctC